MKVIYKHMQFSGICSYSKRRQKNVESITSVDQGIYLNSHGVYVDIDFMFMACR